MGKVTILNETTINPITFFIFPNPFLDVYKNYYEQLVKDREKEKKSLEHAFFSWV